MFFLEVSNASYFPAIIGRTILKFRPSPIYSSPVQTIWHCVNRLYSSHARKDTVVNSPWNMWHTCKHTTSSEMTKRYVFTSNHGLRAPQLSLSQRLYPEIWASGIRRSTVWRMRISELPPKRWYHLPDYTKSHPKDRRETLFLYLYLGTALPLYRTGVSLLYRERFLYI